MKKCTFLMIFALVVSLLAGCAGTSVVYYSDCTCPTGSHAEATEPVVTEAPIAVEGAVKTGIALVANASDSKDANAEENGEAKYDVTVVAVTVDDNGVIQDCIIDSIATSVTFDARGAITSDLSAEVLTKNELGEGYGLKAYAGSKYEWNEQAAALADYACGKTLEELKNGAVGESGKAVDADLASTATIYLGGYVSAIEAAAGNARHLGAQAGDELKMAVISSASDSVSASEEKNGTAQLNVDAAVLTMNGETITSCAIDSVQGKVTFDASGIITSDISSQFQTKDQLGENYGMVAWGNAIAEWNEQAASFAAYVTGKTPAEVAGIAVDESSKAVDADLASSVTISIGGFQALISKAAQ